VIALLIAAALGLLLSIFGTPLAIRVLRKREIGQFIQDDIQGQHGHKQGTPTMGGVVFVGAAVIGWLLAHVQVWTPESGFSLSFRPFGVGGWLAVLALVGMAVVGLLDDMVKYRNKRSLGLSKTAKFGSQIGIAALFAFLATRAGIVTEISFVRPLGENFDLGPFFVVWVLLMLTGAANGVNLADGMDGLAAGSSALVVGAYTIIAFWQFRNSEGFQGAETIYKALSPLELAIISAAMFGALLGFLWWNAPPAKIFMGDVGSQGIGGLLAALALLSNTQLLLALIGAIFVAETLSVILQVASFKLTGERVLRMSPLHYHFDLGGWPETTVVIRFWILTGVGVALGLGFFYADFLRVAGIL
jgi:phospho-N-acetylmuramoyl-pentapeptide-transferase